MTIFVRFPLLLHKYHLYYLILKHFYVYLYHQWLTTKEVYYWWMKSIIFPLVSSFIFIERNFIAKCSRICFHQLPFIGNFQAPQLRIVILFSATGTTVKGWERRGNKCSVSGELSRLARRWDHSWSKSIEQKACTQPTLEDPQTHSVFLS